MNLQYRTDEEGDWNEYDNVYTKIEPDVYYYSVDFEYGVEYVDNIYISSEELASYGFDKDNPNPSILAYLQENYTNPTIMEVINTTQYNYAGYKITLTPDDYVEFKGINPNGITEIDEYGDYSFTVVYRFTVESDNEEDLEIYASGDITSIINGVGGDTGVAAKNYGGLFVNCTWLVTPPNFPDTVLSNSCYSNLFRGCTSLTTAPELPATTLSDRCYESMFMNCTSLNYVKCLSNDEMGIQYGEEVEYWSYTDGWMQNVSESGTFVKSSENNTWGTNSNGIPSGWTVEEE